MKERLKAPELRFPGFTDDWEEHKLGELSNIVGGGTPSTSNPEYWDGDIDWYAPAEIGEQSYVSKSKKTITELGLKKSSARILPIGTVLFTSRAGIGNTAILAKEAATNQGFQSIVPVQNKLDSYFIFSRTNELKRYGEVTGAGSTFVEVSGKQMSKMSIMVPELSEQQKIGSFFKQLDDTIALHQRKLDLLKEQKKGYLQKMFPKNGAKVPELRFAGFADDWEEHKLKDVVEKQIKGKAQFEKLAPGDVEYLDTSRLNGGQAILTNGLKDVTLDDVLILWDGSKAGTVYHGFEGSLGSTLKAYRTSADSKFVYQYLKRYQDNIYNNYRTPNIPHVQKDFLDVFTISVPRSDEQAKIGSFFKQLDDTIALHQRKLDLLKEQKKGYLQKMFV
ncbi:restriction endonuclease subunit S [Lactococcus lactis subsp. lactis]|uniref:restriction endonuclease subunit S n=1 Tax=Lactococcus lactis TaxID=1358 RepID=UPI0021AE57DE|nr:restriction endonuclease subunit S [Lactococcus lactis]MCT0056547.1 restriction endonuclease subunit S [Lactococcus lactis subsp. lactis]